MTFGEKVKAERTKLGMSQDELAAKIGVTRRIIGSYENDKSRPRGMERYKKLAESLNVNVNYLLSEDDAFIADVEDKYGRRGARQAQELLAEVTGLFAGGDLLVGKIGILQRAFPVNGYEGVETAVRVGFFQVFFGQFDRGNLFFFQ